jgi:hypothetical protein
MLDPSPTYYTTSYDLISLYCSIGIAATLLYPHLWFDPDTSVIKLFNAILAASKSTEQTQSTSLSAKAGLQEEKAKRKEKDNVLGRGGKEGGLTKEGFLDLVRKG